MTTTLQNAPIRLAVDDNRDLIVPIRFARSTEAANRVRPDEITRTAP